MNPNRPFKKVAQLGLLTALALILSYVESLLPIFAGIPGLKLGLANLITVFMLYRYSPVETLCVLLARILLSGFLFGNLMSIIFSLCGGLLALGVMILLKKSKFFSMIGVSVAGGFMHNIGQMIAAMFVVRMSQLLYYVPILMISGIVTGCLIGVVSNIMMKRLPRSF